MGAGPFAQRKHMLFKTLQSALALGLFIISLNVQAQIFKIRVTDYGSGGSNQSFRDFVDAEMAKVEENINKGLPNAAPDRLMQGMANSSVMAGKGIGSDYASNMEVFLIGAGMGLGADLAQDPTTKSKMSGVGLAPGLVLGGNMGFIKRPILGMDPKKLNIYVNAMSYKLEHTLNDTPGEESVAGLGMKNLGMHFNYHWKMGKGNRLLNWGGIRLHSGYEYNKTDITFTTKINQEINETSSSGDNINGTIAGNPEASILAQTHSIPVEVSTNVQLLYVLSLYTGLGTDISWGGARAKAALNADESELTCTGTNCTPPQTVKVQAEANLDGSGKVNPLLFRGFAGIQFNIPLVRVFLQVDKALGNDLVGATAGLRLVY